MLTEETVLGAALLVDFVTRDIYQVFSSVTTLVNQSIQCNTNFILPKSQPDAYLKSFVVLTSVNEAYPGKEVPFLSSRPSFENQNRKDNKSCLKEGKER